MQDKTKASKIYDIRERTFKFAQRIIEIADNLPKTAACDVICHQIIKSGTSIAANMEEADGTITRRDFINKTVIVRKEAKETRFWLRLIIDKFIDSKLISVDIQKSQEIISILSAIINKAKK